MQYLHTKITDKTYSLQQDLNTIEIVKQSLLSQLEVVVLSYSYKNNIIKMATVLKCFVIINLKAQFYAYQSIHLEKIRRYKNRYGCVWFQLGGLEGTAQFFTTRSLKHAPFGVLHQPLEHGNVAVNADIYLIPQLGLRGGEVLLKVMHLSNKNVPRTNKITFYYKRNLK